MIVVFINFLIVTVWTAILFPFAAVSLLTLSGDPSMWMARKLWAPLFMRIGRAKLHVRGAQHVDRRRPTIYVCNHQSTLDIAILLVAMDVSFRFVAKSSLKWVPFLGWYLWLAKHILVDRGNSKKAIASLDRAADKIRRGISIVVFAEGTRSDGRVLPFKKGPFLLALKAGVAVVPVTIEGSGRMMPKKSWKVTYGQDIYVTFGAPIDASKYSLDEREKLIRDVRNVIIDQSLATGGQGGDRDDAVAASGAEGIGRPKSEWSARA